MTAQIPEKLSLNGEILELCTEPLRKYFAQHGSPDFLVNCTALWRGYIGDWEIRDDCLYLVGIEAEYRNGQPSSLADVFPDESGPVLARWYSGTLRCPQGGELQYVHMGYDSIHEKDLLLHIEQGRLIGRETRINGTAAHGARQDFRPAAFTTFPRKRKDPETPE
jgi:hypothetical protein